MRRLVFALIAALLSACAVQLNRETEDALYIIYDEGGDIEARERQISELNRTGKRVVIGKNATCLSACTMLLEADNVCVHKNAVLGFHGAHAYPGDPRGDAYWTDRVAACYPAPLETWFYENAADKKLTFTSLSGEQISNMCGIPLCED